MTVFDPCALRGQVEHAALRCVERIALLPRAATVFAMAAQNRGKEFRRNLVVLLIRHGRVDGDRTGFQLLDVAHQVSLLLFRVALVFAAETLGDETPDAGPQNPIGHKIALDQRFVPRGPRRTHLPGVRKTGRWLHYATSFGNHGTKALVVC